MTASAMPCSLSFSVPLSLVLVCVHFKGETSLPYKGDGLIFYTCAEYLLNCSL